MSLQAYFFMAVIAFLLAVIEARRVDDEGETWIVIIKVVVVLAYALFWPLGFLYSLTYQLTKTRKVK